MVLLNESTATYMVHFDLCIKNTTGRCTEINVESPPYLPNNVPIVFLIHGWTSDGSASWYDSTIDALWQTNDQYHFIKVDWSIRSKTIYITAQSAVDEAGIIIANFIVKLNNTYSVPFENILEIGFSLGAQVAGFAGKEVQKLTEKKISRIVALDPAGPLFDGRPKEEMLNPNDAENVVVIHTNGGFAGYVDDAGTIDIFPNGGSSQPGCTVALLRNILKLSETIGCSHSRSYKLFVEALLHPDKFQAKKCYNWIVYLISEDLCEDETVTLGDLTTTATGKYYLKTEDEPPYY
ncbi:lipoprotein lipase-like [Zophobas morio]